MCNLIWTAVSFEPSLTIWTAVSFEPSRRSQSVAELTNQSVADLTSVAEAVPAQLLYLPCSYQVDSRNCSYCTYLVSTKSTVIIAAIVSTLYLPNQLRHAHSLKEIFTTTNTSLQYWAARCRSQSKMVLSTLYHSSPRSQCKLVLGGCPCTIIRAPLSV